MMLCYVHLMKKRTENHLKYSNIKSLLQREKELTISILLLYNYFDKMV